MKTIEISVNRNRPRLLSQRAINATLWAMKQDNQIGDYELLGFDKTNKYDFKVKFKMSSDAVLAKLAL